MYSRHNFGSHAELEVVLAEEGNQHLRPGRADDRMSARVGGVWGRVADLGKPIRVSLGFRVTIGSAARIAVTGRQKLYVYLAS